MLMQIWIYSYVSRSQTPIFFGAKGRVSIGIEIRPTVEPTQLRTTEASGVIELG